MEDREPAIPEAAQACLNGPIGIPTRLDNRIRELAAEIARRASTHEMARRPMTVPGIVPLIATAPVALAPPPETFRRGRDFAAWLGLVPRQHSTGGKQRLGSTAKMGERSLRRLPVRVALANEMARMVWAIMAGGEVYRTPAASA